MLKAVWFVAKNRAVAGAVEVKWSGICVFDQYMRRLLQQMMFYEEWEEELEEEELSKEATLMIDDDRIKSVRTSTVISPARKLPSWCRVKTCTSHQVVLVRRFPRCLLGRSGWLYCAVLGKYDAVPCTEKVMGGGCLTPKNFQASVLSKSAPQRKWKF